MFSAGGASYAGTGYEDLGGGTVDDTVRVDAVVVSTREDSVYYPKSAGEQTERYFATTPAKCLLVNSVDDPSTRFAFVCNEGAQLAYEGIECGEDEFADGALFRQDRADDGTWSEPELVGDEQCVTPADLLAEAKREFATLPIEASAIVVQPPNGWTLVNVPTITYTQDEDQVLAAALLGIPVEIRAVPDEFAWDYGDGSDALVTSDPGAAYPDESVTHTYEQPVDAVTIGLTTTWSGQFRIAGSPTWTDIPGEATTQSAADPLQVYEARSRLVEDSVG
ncbi:hypothetical protein [Cellulosimicrobium arenosum]|uniref:hypothetical protein n=1 Tax=Cellulosimicrobium arenosum TaxID=2708133 RepID=UPI00177D2647|nr:hypothetical protein [Cellulosimicrobium arenosum]